MKKLKWIILVLLIVVYGGNAMASDVPSIEGAKHVMSWQLPSGGWSKDNPDHYTREWNGSERKAKYYQVDNVTPLGTIDNYATVSEIEYLIEVYAMTGDERVKTSILKGIDFLLTMQYDSGGFPQVYPRQDHGASLYENDITINDNAMVSVMKLLQKAVTRQPGYGPELFDETYYLDIRDAYGRGIGFLLEAQVVVDGTKTIWSGQYDSETLTPSRGRKFEPVSLITRESVKVMEFLDSLNSSDPRVEEALKYSELWFVKNAVPNAEFVRNSYSNDYFAYSPGNYMWYRFYEIGTNQPLFGDNDGSVHNNIMAISKERRQNYGWAGNWARDIYRDSFYRGGPAVASFTPQQEVVEVTPVVGFEGSILGEYQAFSRSYVDTSGYHFIESDYDSIITPIMDGVSRGDHISIELTISKTNRRNSELYMANTGLREGKSIWKIGHGKKTKIIEFYVDKEVTSDNSYLEFFIQDGTENEAIHVSEINVSVNEQLVLDNRQIGAYMGEGEIEIFDDEIAAGVPLEEESIATDILSVVLMLVVIVLVAYSFNRRRQKIA